MDTLYKSIIWNNFDNYLASTLHILLTDDIFTDVTLVSDDQKQFKAHKVLLTACSPVFKSLLSFSDASSFQQTVLFMRGISSKDMEALIEFIYVGKTNVHQESVNHFLTIADDLKIVGLSQKNMHGDIMNEKNPFLDLLLDRREEYPSSEISKVTETKDVFNTEIVSGSGKNYEIHTPDIEQDQSLKNDDYSSKKKWVTSTPNISTFSCKKCTFTSMKKWKLTNHQRVHGEYKFECTLCQYKTTRKDIFKLHILGVKHKQRESHGFVCNKCEFKASNREVYETHVQENHKSFHCNECTYQAGRKSHLQSHIESKHLGVSYQCRFCGFSSRSTGYLKEHEESIHGNTSYSCDECSFVTKSRGSLKNHKSVIHAEIDL